MTTPESDHDAPPRDDPDPGRDRADDHPDSSPHPDPEAPGTYVDDRSSTEVPEPNEPA